MVAKKLGLKPGMSLAMVGPAGKATPADVVIELPDGVRLVDRGRADRVLRFVVKAADLARAFADAEARVAEGGTMWLAYPKGGKLGTDISRDQLAYGAPSKEWAPISLVAIDEIWSAIRFRRDAALVAERKQRGTMRPTRPASKAPPRPIVVPPALAKALKGDAKANAFWASLAPSHRREYATWVAEAKRDETRERRLVATMTALRTGKKTRVA